MDEPNQTSVGSPALPVDEEVLQCQNCTQILPRSKFHPNPRQWCIFCVAEETAVIRENAQRLKAEQLSRGLITARTVDQAMGTIEDFFSGLDESAGGARVWASRMNDVIDGLLEKRSFAAAGGLILQLQKLRFLVQRQHLEDDFTQMDLEEKRIKVRMLLMEMLKEQADSETQQQLLTVLENQTSAQMRELDSVTTLAK